MANEKDHEQWRREDVLAERVERLTRTLEKPGEIYVPVAIFSTDVSPSEALVKYLKEHLKLRFADIGRVLNRDQRGIWVAYSRTQKKHPAPLPTKPAQYIIPVSLFTDRTLAILEHIVHYLREQGMPVKAIGELLNKSPSTIAAVHHRVRKKKGIR
jgi:DNA-binding NarL/FixJ family response regulator